MTVDAGQLQMRPCSMVALSPFKMEWSLESRSQECKRMQDKHPNRVPIIVEPAAGVKELPRSKLLLTKTLTVAQVLRIIRSKAGMGPGVKLQLHVSGAVITKQDQRISDVYAAERDEDGFLYCTYSMDEPCSTRSRSTEGADAKDAGSSWSWVGAPTSSWAPTSVYSWSPSGGWSVRVEKVNRTGEDEAGGEVELIQILSKNERLARKRFQKHMRKRAAGPREAAQPAATNTNLAQALASCKLDTALSGMMQIATKSGNGASPGTCPSSYSSYQCGMPCALRVHTALSTAGYVAASS
jgi:GABA(A) receptor-associated protein